jgi:hypothetical protein
VGRTLALKQQPVTADQCSAVKTRCTDITCYSRSASMGQKL